MSTTQLKSLQRKVWEGSVPLEIRLASSECRAFENSNPYLTQCPRLAYLPLLLPRLHSFFSASLTNPNVQFNDAWLSFDGVPLKWHYPVGLLYDLYAGNEPFTPLDQVEDTLPAEINAPTLMENEFGQTQSNQFGRTWKLTVHFSEWPEQHLVRLDEEGKYLHDAFINGVKEVIGIDGKSAEYWLNIKHQADFLRNGTGKVVMSLSKDDSTQLWEAVQNHDLSLFDPIYQKLLRPIGTPLRNIPIKFYLPAAAAGSSSETPGAGSVRVVQTPIPPMISSKQPQTIGTALNAVLPSLFPSRRRCLLAEPVLHGAILPMNAPLEDLLKVAPYADGWLHIIIMMMG